MTDEKDPKKESEGKAAKPADDSAASDKKEKPAAKTADKAAEAKSVTKKPVAKKPSAKKKSKEPETPLAQSWAMITATSIWRSIFRHKLPDDKRSRAMAVLSNVFLHLQPSTTKKHGVKFRFTWGMGGITLWLFIIETITGVLLMFYFHPTADLAYMDIIDLAEQDTLGVMREMHRWGAHAMVITIWLHMLRVFMTGSYKAPREFNWSVGVILLVLTLLLSFTGYLLPWDQLAMWAITVGSNMGRATPFVGHEGPGAALLASGDFQAITASSDVRYALLAGTIVSQATLLRFYVLHCVVLPLVVVILLAIHFWRVRKDGGISGPH